ncbi:hypothetical protein [Alloalcanivorax venustensis]|uniref:hypothetical protein n=1 Tax=Alloalcanivorax venustensis TaxID=172371 RepID=UPI003C355B72
MTFFVLNQCFSVENQTLKIDKKAERVSARVLISLEKAKSFREPFYGAGFVRAGLARERERSSRQDPRDLPNSSTNSVSGIPPGG